VVIEPTEEEGLPQDETCSELYTGFLAGCRLVKNVPAAWDYLTNRCGVADEVVEGLELRFCGEEYGRLMNDLEWAFGREAVLKAGLLARGRRDVYRSFLLYFSRRVGFLVIPYFQDGQPVYLKARPPIDGAKIKTLGVPASLSTGDPAPCLYNVDCLKATDRVLVCEGEIAVMRALTRKQDAVGVPGWSHFRDEWIGLFRGKEVTLVMGAVMTGTETERELPWRFAEAGLPVPEEVVLGPGRDFGVCASGSVRTSDQIPTIPV
jgi:hypothetical protein